MDRTLSTADNIKQLERELRYECYDGITTRHMCDCNERMCRRYKCRDCIQKELEVYRMLQAVSDFQTKGPPKELVKLLFDSERNKPTMPVFSCPPRPIKEND